jgi:hypothetical protein
MFIEIKKPNLTLNLAPKKNQGFFNENSLVCN